MFQTIVTAMLVLNPKYKLFLTFEVVYHRIPSKIGSLKVENKTLIEQTMSSSLISYAFESVHTIHVQNFIKATFLKIYILSVRLTQQFRKNWSSLW